MAESSADIDTVYLYGYGFPAEVGGPMTWADRQGLPAIRERLNTLAERHGEHWQPAELIDSLASWRAFRRLQEGGLSGIQGSLRDMRFVLHELFDATGHTV